MQALIAKDPSLARAHYEYRKPLYVAVRENRLDVARFLRCTLLLAGRGGRSAFARLRGFAATARHPSHLIMSEGWLTSLDDFRNWLIRQARVSL